MGGGASYHMVLVTQGWGGAAKDGQPYGIPCCSPGCGLFAGLSEAGRGIGVTLNLGCEAGGGEAANSSWPWTIVGLQGPSGLLGPLDSMHLQGYFDWGRGNTWATPEGAAEC